MLVEENIVRIWIFWILGLLDWKTLSEFGPACPPKAGLQEVNYSGGQANSNRGEGKTFENKL